MAADSYIKAVEDLIAGLTPTLFPGNVVPPIWFDEAPQQTGAGAQQHTPYIILRDGGGTAQWDEAVNAYTPSTFTLEVYDRSLGVCDSIMKAILWNGQNPNLKLGLAFATLSLNAPLYSIVVMPTTDQHSYAGVDYQGQRVHKYAQSFDVTVGLRGTG